MNLLHNTHQIPSFSAGSVVTAGNFDGVHLGHQALLKQLRNKADLLQLPLCVLLFEPQPAEFFNKNEAPARLSNLREKIRIMKNLGVDYVYCLKFDKKLSTMPAIPFAEQYLFGLLKARYLLVGKDFHFGYARQGNIALLKTLASQHGCELEVFDDFQNNGKRISSTYIRQLLSEGQLEAATSMLGRSYGFCARVVKGAGLGNQWGIPTANMLLSGKKLPLKGVFCVQVQQGKSLWNAVANVGTRPTVDGTRLILEVHILDFNGMLYGTWLQVNFLHKLRDEKRFSSVDALIAQIHLDIAHTKEFFNHELQRELHNG